MFQFESILRTALALSFAPVLALAGAAPVGADTAAEQAGRLLVKQVYLSPRGEDMAVRATMVLTAEGEDDKTRNLTVFSRGPGVAGSARRLQFSTPSELADTTVLSARLDSAEHHWLFIAGAQEVRAIAPAAFDKPVVETQIHYHDLLARPPQADRHTLVGEEAIDDRLCKVVDSVPNDPSDAPYSKRRMWVYEKFMLPLRVDYFRNDEATPYRRYEVHKIQKVSGIWTVMASSTTDLVSGRSTRILVNGVAYDQSLPDALFDPGAMMAPEQVKRFEP